MSLLLEDFQPINDWTPNYFRKTWRRGGLGGPKYLIDEATERNYLNESKGCVRFKCILLTLGTPIVHSIASLVNVAYRIVKLVSFSHFWMDKEEEKSHSFVIRDSYSFKGRLKDAGEDLLRVITAPVAFIGLELAAIYGIFTPYDGRKLYASIERALYNDSFNLAPCFQPDPTRHLFGGDINKKNTF